MIKKLLVKGLLGGAIAVGIVALALAQSIPVPQVTQINPTDLFHDIPLGQPVAGNVYAPAPLLGNYSATLPGNNSENDLIGGDFGKNLFQDGATVSTIATTPTYVADQWAAFSGTSTTIGGAQETGAADIPYGYTASLRLTRSGSGILQSCVAQEVSTQDSVRYQGLTAEIDFHALAGSGFSAANDALSVFLVQGTGTNEGMANLAHTINSALGGSYWTGYSAAATANATVDINGSWNRYSVVVPVASTTTELGVVMCWTPVGASPSNDYFEFTGAQLTPNSALAGVAGSTGAALNINDPRAKAFMRRTQVQEANLQYGFYYRINEVSGAYYAAGEVTASNVEDAVLSLPTGMWEAPSCTITAGGLHWNNAGAALAVSAPACSASKNQPNLVTVTDAATATAGDALVLYGTTTTGIIKVSARF